MLVVYVVWQCYFLYAGSLYWLDGYASYADCLAMLAKLAACLSWLYWLGSFSGYVLWLEILALLDGGLCCISWRLCLLDAWLCRLIMLAG
jgi:hypothetical protein